MTKAACRGPENGSATARVMRGEGPYSYSWFPSNYNTQTVNNLRSGKYIVTVTGKNGTSVKDSVAVGEYEMNSYNFRGRLLWPRKWHDQVKCSRREGAVYL